MTHIQINALNMILNGHVLESLSGCGRLTILISQPCTPYLKFKIMQLQLFHVGLTTNVPFPRDNIKGTCHL